MLKAILIGAQYIASDMKNFHGSHNELSKQLSKGWSIASGNDGSYILARSAQAWFTFKANSNIYRYNLAEEILTHFEMYKLTEKAFENFKKELQSNKLTMNIDENGCYELKS